MLNGEMIVGGAIAITLIIGFLAAVFVVADAETEKRMREKISGVSFEDKLHELLHKALEDDPNFLLERNLRVPYKPKVNHKKTGKMFDDFLDEECARLESAQTG